MTKKAIKEKEIVETPQVKGEYVAKDEVEKTILSFMNTIDKGSFSAKDKVLFYKELVYMLKG
jgi:hypothetical protein